MIKRKNLFWEYFFLTFVLLWSGGAFTYGLFENWPFVMFVLATIALISRKLNLEKWNWFVVAIFTIVILLQTIFFGGSMTSVVVPILKILAISIMAMVVRPNFNRVFVKIVAFFACISLIFWVIDITPLGHSLLLNLAKGLPQMGGDILAERENSWVHQNAYTLFFYSVTDSPDNIRYYIWARNPGPFFEAGRFTIVLAISLALILFSGNYRKYKFTFYLILIANITTFSTTGYFAMLVLFLLYFFGREGKIKLGNVIWIALVLMVAYYIMRLSFMGEKIFTQVSDLDNTNSRFGAMVYHWQQILQSPFIGYGSFLNKTFSYLEMSPNGITNMMRRWGIPIFIFSIWLLYIGSKAIMIDNKIYRWTFVTILLILAYSQTVMDSPLYYLLYFIGSKNYAYGKQVQNRYFMSKAFS